MFPKLMNDLEPFYHAFAENFTAFDELGAAVSVWQDGTEIVACTGGHKSRDTNAPWAPDTLVLWWSATKGPAAACLLHVLQEQGLDPSVRVSSFWPEFAQNGKTEITLTQLLSHQAGLSSVHGANISMLDHEAMKAALETQAPLWTPGEQHGYHPRTFGYLVDECVRRLSGGTTLGTYWQQVFARPLALDFWIGLPAEFHDRVATIYASRTPEPPEVDRAFYDCAKRTGTLQQMAFSAGGGGPISAMNRPEVRSASLPALGGIGSAHGLAKFYAMLACGGKLEDQQLFSEKALGWMQTPLVNGPDHVFLSETSFSCGFMLDPLDANGEKKRRLFGPSKKAFGHPGAGGGLAFADPENRISFAYGMNQMSLATLPVRRAGALVQALYACL